MMQMSLQSAQLNMLFKLSFKCSAALSAVAAHLCSELGDARTKRKSSHGPNPPASSSAVLQLFCSLLPVQNSPRSLWSQEDCGCNPKNLHGQSNSLTPTRTGAVAEDQGHVSGFGLLLPSCWNRFWSRGHNLKAGTKMQKKVVFHSLRWTGVLTTLTYLLWCYSW